LLNQNPSDDSVATSSEAAAEARALRRLRDVRAPRGLTPQQVRRIAERLDAGVVRVRRRSLLPVLAVVALVLSVGTAAAWATGTLRRWPVIRALFSAKDAAPPAVAPTRPRIARHSIEIAAPEKPVPAADDQERRAPPAPQPHEASRSFAPPAGKRAGGAPSVARPERVTPREAPVVVAPPPPALPDDPIAREGESFARVLQTWRRSRDSRAALSALDLHERRFGAGQMALESRLLRVEILLSDGREREALALLDRLDLGAGNVPRGRELLTVRGELRIKAGRCDDGRADLASIVGGADGLAQRARNALTHCR
jgi:hypothetical protein